MECWKRWADERPPNEFGVYRWKATANILGMELTPHWTEALHLCGMGHSESEWWPLLPCHWDGYKRYMTRDVWWRPAVEGVDYPHGIDNLRKLQPDWCDIYWEGLHLYPCPFTGEPPEIKYHGKYILAPPWDAAYVCMYTSSVFITGDTRFTSMKELQEEWNTRKGSC